MASSGSSSERHKSVAPLWPAPPAPENGMTPNDVWLDEWHESAEEEEWHEGGEEEEWHEAEHEVANLEADINTRTNLSDSEAKILDSEKHSPPQIYHPASYHQGPPPSPRPAKTDSTEGDAGAQKALYLAEMGAPKQRLLLSPFPAKEGNAGAQKPPVPPRPAKEEHTKAQKPVPVPHPVKKGPQKRSPSPRSEKEGIPGSQKPLPSPQPAKEGNSAISKSPPSPWLARKGNCGDRKLFSTTTDSVQEGNTGAEEASPSSQPSKIFEEEASAGGRKLRVGRPKNPNASGLEHNPALCPRSIELQMDPPSEADGTYLLQDGHVVNKRMVYKSGPNVQGFPLFFVYLLDDCWALQEHDNASHNADVLLVCKDAAPHPAAVRKPWQIMGDNGEFQEEPGVQIWEKNADPRFYDRVLREGKAGFSVSGNWNEKAVRKVLVQSTDSNGWAQYEHVCIGDEIVALDDHDVASMTREDFENRLAMRPLKLRFCKGSGSWNAPVHGNHHMSSSTLKSYPKASGCQSNPFMTHLVQEFEAKTKKLGQKLGRAGPKIDAISAFSGLKKKKHRNRSMENYPIPRVERKARSRSPLAAQKKTSQNGSPRGLAAYYDTCFEFQQRKELWKNAQRQEERNQEISGCTFHPEGLTWKKVLENHHDGSPSTMEDMIERLHDKSLAQKDKTMHKLVERREKQLLKPCTFAPETHSYPDNLIDRPADWLERLYDERYHAKKEKKIAALKAKKEQKEMKECTFVPQVNSHRKIARHGSSPTFGGRGEERWPNNQDFIQRQECFEDIRQLKYNLMYSGELPHFCTSELDGRSLRVAATAQRSGRGPAVPVANLASAQEWREAAAMTDAVVSNQRSLDVTLSEPELEFSPVKTRDLRGLESPKGKGRGPHSPDSFRSSPDFLKFRGDNAMREDEEEQCARDLEELAAKEKVMDHINKKLNQCERLLMNAQKTPKQPRDLGDLQNILNAKVQRIEAIKQERIAAERKFAAESEANCCSPANVGKALGAKAPGAKAKGKARASVHGKAARASVQGKAKQGAPKSPPGSLSPGEQRTSFWAESPPSPGAGEQEKFSPGAEIVPKANSRTSVKAPGKAAAKALVKAPTKANSPSSQGTVLAKSPGHMLRVV